MLQCTRTKKIGACRNKREARDFIREVTDAMAGILHDARRIKAYEGMLALGALAGEDKEYCDRLWAELILDRELFDELVYYLENHSLLDRVKCEGYGLTDLYIWQMNRYNIIGDTGKNTGACNKERMVLHAFCDMVEMKKNPAVYIKHRTNGRGMDEQM
ncbi:MAG: hypothetical protein LUE96_02520 [Lachnospiraceae bacterium]|nr:hypothetical protein [Lachnospiraceae bacterium]